MDSLVCEMALTRAMFEAAFVARRAAEHAAVAREHGAFVASSDVRPSELDAEVARVLHRETATRILTAFGYRRTSRGRLVYWVERCNRVPDLDENAPPSVDTLPSIVFNHVYATHVLPLRQRRREQCANMRRVVASRPRLVSRAARAM